MIKHIENIYGDGIGYVSILEKMGDDYMPAEDARTSTGKGRLGPEKDAQLQARLMRDGHTSPFEGVIVKVEVKIPLFIRAEIDRHRTLGKIGEDDLVTPDENMRCWFARNEMSGRYVNMPAEYYHPQKVRAQSKANKQGGLTSEAIPDEIGEAFLRTGKEVVTAGRRVLDEAVEAGIEKGLARIYNTQNQYTVIRYTGSLKNWLDACALRWPDFVLWECKRPFDVIQEALAELFPSCVELWRKEVRDAVKFNRDEVEYLRALYDADVWNLSGENAESLHASIKRKLGL